MPCSERCGIAFCAARIPSAIARSNRPPVLRMSAGASDTVIRSRGNGNPELMMAPRTRSLDSRTAVSGMPTTLKRGSPPDRNTSMVTGGASTPSCARLARIAILIGPPWPVRKRGQKPFLPGDCPTPSIFREKKVSDPFFSIPSLRTPRRAVPAHRVFPAYGRARLPVPRTLRA